MSFNTAPAANVFIVRTQEGNIKIDHDTTQCYKNAEVNKAVLMAHLRYKANPPDLMQGTKVVPQKKCQQSIIDLAYIKMRAEE